MKASEIQTHAATLYFKLLQDRFLPASDPLVIIYVEEEEVRHCLRRIADASGVRVVLKGDHLHLLARPGCVFATSISEMKGKIKTYENKIDAYLMGTIMMVFLAEVDSRFSSVIKWENEGLSYSQIEELVTTILDEWKKVNDETQDRFSVEWSLAVKEMYNKWRLLNYSKTSSNGKVTYNTSTKLGVIHHAMRELEKEGLVYIRYWSQTSLVTPSSILFERLDAIFEENDRFEVIQELIKDTNPIDEVGA